MTGAVYKICDRDVWAAAEAAGAFAGSPDDLRDGFIHLSTGPQLAGTAAKHFAGAENLVLVAADPARLGDRLRWEPSRGGRLFPHLYGVLDIAAVISVRPLRLGADGTHLLPEGVAR